MLHVPVHTWHLLCMLTLNITNHTVNYTYSSCELTSCSTCKIWQFSGIPLIWWDAIARRRVVFPVPLRPTRPYRRPKAMVTVASCNTIQCHTAGLQADSAPGLQIDDVFHILDCRELHHILHRPDNEQGHTACTSQFAITALWTSL